MVTSFVRRGHNFTFYNEKLGNNCARHARRTAVCSFFLVHLRGCSHSPPYGASSAMGPRQVLLKLIFFQHIFPAESSSRLSPVVPKYHLVWSETFYDAMVRVVWGGVKSIL